MPAIPTTERKRIRLDKNSKTVRFYLWLYGADPKRINTCKLLWALIFAIPALVIRYTVWPILKLVIDYAERRDVAKRQERLEKTPEVSRGEGALDKVSVKSSAFFAKWSGVIRFIGGTLLALFFLGVLGLLLYALITNPLTFLVALGVTAGIFLVCVVILLIIEFFDKGKGRGFFRLLKALFDDFHNHTCAEVDLQEGPSNV